MPWLLKPTNSPSRSSSCSVKTAEREELKFHHVLPMTLASCYVSIA